MPPNDRAVEALKNIANELELILLREGEWKVIEV
jgi:hypothetical protein